MCPNETPFRPIPTLLSGHSPDKFLAVLLADSVTDGPACPKLVYVFRTTNSEIEHTKRENQFSSDSLEFTNSSLNHHFS